MVALTPGHIGGCDLAPAGSPTFVRVDEYVGTAPPDPRGAVVVSADTLGPSAPCHVWTATARLVDHNLTLAVFSDAGTDAVRLVAEQVVASDAGAPSVALPTAPSPSSATPTMAGTAMAMMTSTTTSTTTSMPTLTPVATLTSTVAVAEEVGAATPITASATVSASATATGTAVAAPTSSATATGTTAAATITETIPVSAATWTPVATVLPPVTPATSPAGATGSAACATTANIDVRATATRMFLVRLRRRVATISVCIHTSPLASVDLLVGAITGPSPRVRVAGVLRAGDMIVRRQVQADGRGLATTRLRLPPGLRRATRARLLVVVMPYQDQAGRVADVPIASPTPTIAASTVITLEGSAELASIVQPLADRYEATHPGVRVAVEAGTNLDGLAGACDPRWYAASIGLTTGFDGDNQIVAGGRLVDQPVLAVCPDLVDIPVAVTTIPVVYNLPGEYFTQRAADGLTPLHPLRLTPQALAAIYLGRVTRRDDPAIVALNPGAPLPDQPIITLHEHDQYGPGETVDDYLQADPDWKATVVATPTLGLPATWPDGSTDDGDTGRMSADVEMMPYALGYTTEAGVMGRDLLAAAMRNAAGAFITPSEESARRAVAGALADSLPDDFRKSLVTATDPGAYPLTTFYFMIVRGDLSSVSDSPAERQEIAHFLAWTIDPAGGQQLFGAARASAARSADAAGALGPGPWTSVSGVACAGDGPCAIGPAAARVVAGLKG